MLSIQDRAFDFSIRIVKLHQHLMKSGETSRILSNQILRSGTSIGANLEEAKGGQSKADSGVAELRDDGSRHRNILKLEVVN